MIDGTVVDIPGVRMDLAVKFEEFDSMEPFLVLDMDKYDLILGMPWLEKHEPWVDWSGNAIGDSRPAVSDVSLAGAIHLEAQPEVSALLNLEELSMEDFLAALKAGAIAEMVLLKPEIPPEYLNFSSVMDEVVLEGFTKQRATSLSSEILKNPEDPAYPLVKEVLGVVSKHPPSQLPPDRECEVIDAFFAEKAKSGMVRESKSPHSTPTFCTPIPRKDVLLNHMSGCTLYSTLDLVDGYYQILMHESDIPLTAGAFDIIKASLQHAPVLVLANENYTPMMRFLLEGKDAKVDRLSP
ncbi:Pol protein [Phytophthora palmivora]|uniref:Pol protein n=1 Tax=Phytophthora palmivora TaxID=4796 RepID=A0A2P4YD69_9STRA|nr:Pol protein [Phytophthora palmivora]